MMMKKVYIYIVFSKDLRVYMLKDNLVFDVFCRMVNWLTIYTTVKSMSVFYCLHQKTIFIADRMFHGVTTLHSARIFSSELIAEPAFNS